MEERKLTDEEIVKALDVCYNSPCCNADCPYFNKNGRNLCLENKAFYRDLKRIAEKYVKQKAEIERLTEENEYLDGCAKQFLADYQKCEVELSEQEDKCLDCPYQLKFNEIEKQAVKNTAKEIFPKVKERLKHLDNEWEISNALYPLEQEYLNGKGVEVE